MLESNLSEARKKAEICWQIVVTIDLFNTYSLGTHWPHKTFHTEETLQNKSTCCLEDYTLVEGECFVEKTIKLFYIMLSTLKKIKQSSRINSNHQERPLELSDF